MLIINATLFTGAEFRTSFRVRLTGGQITESGENLTPLPCLSVNSAQRTSHFMPQSCGRT